VQCAVSTRLRGGVDKAPDGFDKAPDGADKAIQAYTRVYKGIQGYQRIFQTVHRIGKSILPFSANYILSRVAH
jgi:hypothetical protein